MTWQVIDYDLTEEAARALAAAEGLTLVPMPGTITGWKGVSPEAYGRFKVNYIGGRSFETVWAAALAYARLRGPEKSAAEAADSDVVAARSAARVLKMRDIATPAACRTGRPLFEVVSALVGAFAADVANDCRDENGDTTCRADSCWLYFCKLASRWFFSPKWCCCAVLTVVFYCRGGKGKNT